MKGGDDMIPLIAEYGSTGAMKIVGLVVLIIIIAGVVYWRRKKAKKILDKIKDRVK